MRPELSKNEIKSGRRLTIEIMANKPQQEK